MKRSSEASSDAERRRMLSFAQMKDRKLVQWGLAYLAGAWLLLQLVQLLGDMYAWPASVTRVVPPLLVVGFFAALILAWYHGEKGEQRIGAVELLMLTGILVVAGGVLALLNARDNVGAAEAAATEAAAVPEQGSIAVLPFVNMSTDEENEYFADGLSEELLNALSQLPELRVAARTSAFAFEDKDVGIDSIARALNVRHVLEGSVRKDHDQLRITAQLIDAETGYHLWSATYDSELRSIFAVQDSISRAIVEALRIELGAGREGRPLVEKQTTSPEAHTLVLQGDHAAAQRTQQALQRAKGFYREALALDPDYARAHAGLADVFWYESRRRLIPATEGFAQAEREAERALALDSTLAVAHVVLAKIAGDRDWDWEAADAHFAQAIEANPGYARAYNYRGLLLVALGRTEEAIESARHAVSLDPVWAGSVNNLGVVYSNANQPQKAIEQFRAALALEPGHPIPLFNLALNYSRLGRHEEALQTAERAVEAAPELTLHVLATVQARAGRRVEAEETLAKLRALREISPYELAILYAALGNAERVFALLERAVEERDPWVTALGVDPAFDPYRDDPRMRALLDRMGLP